MKFELHPLCALFPRMVGAEFVSLKADIKANGLRQPIVTHQGMILDGGNRYAACMELGIKPMMTEYTGTNLVTYVLSANFYRRHLSAGQQAAIVASATDWAKAQTVGKPKSGNATGLQTVADRAAVSGASDKTQRMADKLVKEQPALAQQVVAGKKSLNQATKESKPAKPSKPAAAPVEPTAPPPEDEYTELDAAHDQISGLQDLLAVASMGNVSDEDKAQATELIAELRSEVRTLRASLKAVTQSRDTLMNELAQVKRQCLSQARELKSLKVAA